MYCYNCGVQVNEHSRFCQNCGANLQETAQNDTGFDSYQAYAANEKSMKETFYNATRKVNRMVGEEGGLDVNLKDVFSSVFQKHTKEEAELIFISGTKTTTPEENAISTTWPKPWLFSRIFIILAITYFFLVIGAINFQNMNALPGMIIIGSFAAPFSLLILFWEMNAPQNISIYEVAKMFFIGGTASLVATMILYMFFPVYDLDVSGAIVVGVVEEIGKLAIIIYFVRKLNPKFILNGLLIGAAIGAGFAAFESAGYAYTFGELYGEGAMMEVIFTRAWMAVGTHVVWSAIAGGALVYVKADQPLQSDLFFDGRFVRLFLLAVALHAVWDMPLYGLHHFYFLFIVLIGIAWVFIFSMMNAGLRQIARLSSNEKLSE
ncbi:MAG TPA: PrsW family intramembrane metalloprotease [Pseudogracilibacillus sp.]|nr:PrsW family intramembrane metalloprotease [Pseudogracilibacillus sp.]